MPGVFLRLQRRTPALEARASAVTRGINHVQRITDNSGRTLLVTLLLTLAGCSGKGCFGLCDARDDDDDTPTTPTGPSTSCIVERQIERRNETLFYAADNTAAQSFQYYDSQLPAGTNNAPVLIWITGDDFSGGSLSTTNGLPSQATLIARRLGAHFAPIRYRSAAVADWPAQILDVKTAIQYLVDQNSTLNLNIDTTRIYVGGDAAGALLAALASNTFGVQELTPDLPGGFSARVALVIGLGGVYNLSTLVNDANGVQAMCNNMVPPIASDPVISLLDCTASNSSDPLSGCDPTLIEQASPATHLFADDPPMLFYGGAMDCVVPPAQTTAYQALFAEDNSTLRTYANDDDTLASFSTADLAQDIVMIPELDCDDDT